MHGPRRFQKLWFGVALLFAAALATGDDAGRFVGEWIFQSAFVYEQTENGLLVLRRSGESPEHYNGQMLWRFGVDSYMTVSPPPQFNHILDPKLYERAVDVVIWGTAPCAPLLWIGDPDQRFQYFFLNEDTVLLADDIVGVRRTVAILTRVSTAVSIGR